jgi:predicted RNase H-like HicB family nuclease
VETRYYPAIVERGAHGYGVFFPDLPGCVSAGDTLQEAARNAEEALQLHVRGAIEDGDPLPAPSELDTIECDPEVDEAARVLVRVAVPEGASKAVRINVTLPDALLRKIDRAVELRGGSRSRFLAEAAERALEPRLK